MTCINHDVPHRVFLTLSVQGHKKIAGTSSTTGSDRFRLLVSDGRHLNSFAMLATQLNDKVTSGELSDFTVIQITRYITSMVTNADRGDKYVFFMLSRLLSNVVENADRGDKYTVSCFPSLLTRSKRLHSLLPLVLCILISALVF